MSKRHLNLAPEKESTPIEIEKVDQSCPWKTKYVAYRIRHIGGYFLGYDVEEHEFAEDFVFVSRKHMTESQIERMEKHLRERLEFGAPKEFNSDDLTPPPAA